MRLTRVDQEWQRRVYDFFVLEEKRLGERMRLAYGPAADSWGMGV